MNKIKIICEIGWNHLGDMELAKQMIKAAKDSGADYAKFQTWSVDRLKSGEWDTDGRKEIYKNAELSFDDHVNLINYCNKIGIEFLSSVFSIHDANMLLDLDVKKVKIPSFESRNEKLCRFCLDNFDEVFISFGTSTLNEVWRCYSWFSPSKNNDVTFMHCVSSYPLKPENANIKRLNHIKERVPGINYGYSDHMEGVDSAKVALEFGVNVIEKHFTIDKNLPGRDNKFACLPEDIRELREYINLREKMLLMNVEDYQLIEEDARQNYTGRFDG